MTSGVAVNDECVKVLEEVRMHRKYRYVIFSLADNFKEIKIKKTGRRDADYQEFLEDMNDAMKERQCRYAIYDVDFLISDCDCQQNRSKIIFILWSPDNATVKQKMLYSSSKGALRLKLAGVGKELQATDEEELCWTALMDKCLERETY
ncbi:uncharacterized protein LOC135484746 [Lineus longissimus]|uniref:uncharacterized protein LOC135484746 n=1 Tax=Lineus longissimus TaxID=88925 RepID=UPI002B4E6878